MKPFSHLLPLVEKPSRYLGNEINAVKCQKDAAPRFALAFPDLYEIGMSHFGLQILYHIINCQPGMAAERVYAPGTDMAAKMKQEGLPLASLETGTPLSRFDIIGFSLLYELNYTNVLMMLDLAGIPFLAADRDEAEPLIIAGGPCTVNPEPVADFFDAMVVGDGEAVVLEMARAWREWNSDPGRNKQALLSAWSKIEGIYVPSLFKISDTPEGFTRALPTLPEYPRVTRAVVADLDCAPFPVSPVVPYGRPVHDRLRLEVARGCTRGCRFCQAGMIYRPVRERCVQNLLDLAEKSINATGMDEISLLSLSTGDYGCLAPLMNTLFDRYAADHVALSLPSFRAGSLSADLMDLIRRVRKTGFTIAPEAGSERLRQVINKNITEQEILSTVAQAFDLGWRTVKLYFMIGLPTETDEDIDAIVDLVEKIRRNGRHGRKKGSLHVSVATFIPKPHVPFQWEAQLSLAASIEKIQYLKKQLNRPGVEFKWQKPEVSLLEGLFARGDRKLSRLLINAFEKGCRFDGWTDSFDFPAWQAALADTGIDVNHYTEKRDRAHDLPWAHIDVRVSKQFLVCEYEKAVSGQSTPDCRFEACQDCGVCDFEQLMPKIHAPGQVPPTPRAPSVESVSAPVRAAVHYSKRDPAHYFGHLELVRIFERAVRRSGIEVEFTGGFHPKPKFSFHDPLPVGMQSEKEIFFLTLKNRADLERFADRVNSQLPDGLEILACREADKEGDLMPPDSVVYRVELSDGVFDPALLAAFAAAPEMMIEKKSKRGRRLIDLKPAVASIEQVAANRLKLMIRHQPGITVRPAETIGAIFHLSDETLRRARIIKLEVDK